MAKSRERRRAHWIPTLVSLAVVLVAGAAVGWAATTVLTPPVDVLAASSYTYVDVVPGEVGSSIQLNTAAAWVPIPAGTNQATGTVTSVNVKPGQAVSVGTTLYTADLRPVVIAQGETPAFRAMAQETFGTDVAQLQQALTEMDFYSGAVDGEFGSLTSMAVKAWQKTLGVTRDGVVQPGDLVFVPSLPTHVALDTEVIYRGATLTGGEDAVRTLGEAPTFTVPVSESQGALMPAGTRVEIKNTQGDPWEGFVDSQVAEVTGDLTVTLVGVDGATICGEVCDSIPVTGQTLLPSVIVTVEPVSGLTVPSAALLSATDGTITVIDGDGVSHKVTVLVSARGLSVIDGVPLGTSVRIPAAAATK